ncbi:XRE family transcriptional regulator [Intrasporangium chromatireducens Q5-1]|uniref:XRE family transcriptional regulator n=1 Tax=Intrasporangium chromatireducens Q5-1 TaxID=584657 RepID=W9GFW2_9MICO|nr:XRE family transcriptional regulator [Intrasporangium chromatireducens]EWT04067.1 XRE family transcriptional regulator [Intrasporangium chromatireducens Q5-1]
MAGSNDQGSRNFDATEALKGLEIGARLRAARVDRGMTIGQVADLTGLTKGFISQIERDKTAASVGSLLAICNALNLHISALFEPPSVYLVRHAERAPTQMTGVGVTDFLLSPPASAQFQIIETHIEPGGGSDPQPYRLPADAECVIVLEGSLEMQIEGDTFHLESGDALTFRARDPHVWRNPSVDEVTRVVWVLTRSQGL